MGDVKNCVNPKLFSVIIYSTFIKFEHSNRLIVCISAKVKKTKKKAA